ncbi:MAG: DegT/DnrJ/EryC1/StrS family aminotransferase [Acidobacteriota bacterium]|jgi:dTDP-4-amino-4,6-dideoxygalactose transaminase
MIRLAAPEIPEEALESVREVLESGWFVQGKHVAAFERAVANFAGIEHAVAVTSGTAALHVALLAMGIGAGDEVAVSAYSYPASANVIELCGARPLFVDIDPRTFNMDPGRLEACLHGRAPAPAAIIVVHAFGQMADLDAIGEVAAGHGVPLIEDAACALGATWSNRPPGANTRVACFSFHPRKAITTGEGGMLVTADGQLAAAARALRNHGLAPDAPSPDFILPGFNYRMTEFQAVLGSSALRRLPASIVTRRALAARYDDLLADMVEVPLVPPQSGHVYQSYVVLLPAQLAEHRAEIIAALAEHGVESTIGTWAIPNTTFYREHYGYGPDSFPVTTEIFRRSLSLPLHDKISEQDQRQVAAALALVLESFDP